jgi:hypothetical protein
MKAYLCVLLFPAWVACSDDPVVTPPVNPTPATIHVTSAVAPVLVAFQDGFNVDWKTAAASTAVDVTVHGPYTVAVVCQEPDAWRTWQFAGTPDDDTTLTTPCATPPARHKVTGHVLRAGSVYLADASAHSTTDDWNFELSVPSGTYDLIATTEIEHPQGDDRIAVQRGIAVTGDLALSTAIDVDRDGMALASVALTPDSPLPKNSHETLQAVVDLQTSFSLAPAQIYDGPAGSALVAPDAALTADDLQTATLEAVKSNSPAGTVIARGLRATFRFGDATDFTLPSGIVGVAWSIDHGDLSVALPQLPELDVLQVIATGASGDGAKTASLELDITSNYFGATQLARPKLDTSLPGFQPAWQIDVSKAYSRSVASHHAVDAGVEIASNSESVDPSATSGAQ